jgi:DNA repair protein RadC
MRTDAELLAVVCGLTVEKATAALTAAGSLRGLVAAPPRGVAGIRFAAAAEVGRRLGCETLARGAPLSDPDTTRRFLVSRLRDLECEVFCVMFLDNRNRVIAFDEMFRGTIDGASIHPREVVKAALRHNAAALILAHNHPSGVADPSDADRLITRRLREALGLIDVRVLDHFVVGDGYAVSFAERGWL